MVTSTLQSPVPKRIREIWKKYRMGKGQMTWR
jgi:hypothetical protein